MKVSELRIGNLIHCTRDKKTVKVLEIYTPYNNKKYVASFDLQKGRVEDILSNYKGVPITEQWLKDFKFDVRSCECCGKYYDIKVSAGYLSILNGKYCIFPKIDDLIKEEHWVKIKYIHQLQNLYFALNGTELTKK